MKNRTLLNQIRVVRNERSSIIDMKTSHYHDGYEIYYLVNGNVRYFLDNKVYDLIPGDVILIPPNTLHKTNVTSDFPAERLLIDFTKDFLKKEESDPIFKCFKNHYVNKSENYINYLTQIEKEFNNQDEYSENIIKSLLNILLSKLSRVSGNTKSNVSSSPLIEKILSYINANFSEELTLQLLANEFSISKNYLSKLFKVETGFGFSEYLTITRIKKAEHMLISTTMSISEIAFSCGFHDSNYFSYVFKKTNGNSPLQYRKKR